MVRAVLAALAAIHAWWGAWAWFAPRNFFDHFPGFGRHWTGAYPPFNEHLVTDLGATFLTLAVLLGLAAWLNDRRVTRVVLTGVILFSALHLVYHATHHGGMAGVDLSLSLTTLALGVLVPLALLAATRRRTHYPPDRPS